MSTTILNSAILHRLRRAAMLVVAAVLGTALIGAGKVQPIYAARTGRELSLKQSAQPPRTTPAVDSSIELLHSVAAPAATAAAPVQEESIDEMAIPAAAVMPARAVHSPSTRVIWMEVTAYCACKKCCGPNAIGVTASGRSVRYNGGRFVAADTDLLPFGTRLKIPGYAGGRSVEVQDRGGAIKGNRLDVYFASHEVAKEFGRQWLPVTVIDE